MSGEVLALILSTTAVALAVFLSEVRRLAADGVWRQGETWVFILGPLGLSGVDMIVSTTDKWTQARDPYDNVLTIGPGWTYRVQLLLFLLILLGCVVGFINRVARPSAVLNGPALLFLLLAGLADWSALMHGDDPLKHVYYVVLLAILAATTVAPRGLSVSIGLGTFAFFSAILSGCMVVLNRQFAVVSCGSGKCGLLGFNYRGFLDNENALALYLSLAMPFVFIAFSRRAGVIAVSYMLFLVLLTGSRSGAAAGIVTYVVLLIVRPDLRRPFFSTFRAAVLYGVLAVGGVVGAVLPLTTNDADAFTGRGYLWMLARHSLSGSNLLFGAGALGWQHYRDFGLIDFSEVYSVHNEWLQVAFSTGLLGVVILICALVLLIAQAGRQFTLVVGCILVPVVALAPTERPWSIDVIDWVSWALPAALLCYPLVPVSVSAEGTMAPGASRSRRGTPTPTGLHVVGAR